MVIKGLPNGNQDVFAIELKNPNGTGELSAKQLEYRERLLLKCHVKTFVSSNYEEIVIALREHYREVSTRARILAITDKREEEYDCSTNSNPKCWLNRLKNKAALIKERKKRGIVVDNAVGTFNTKIIEILIAADSS